MNLVIAVLFLFVFDFVYFCFVLFFFCNRCLSSAEKDLKNSGLNGDSNRCSALPVELSCQPGTGRYVARL